LEFVSKGLLFFPRKVGGSKWIYPSKGGNGCFDGNLPLQNPQIHQDPVVSKFSFSGRKNDSHLPFNISFS
jgi:hypothetical protein